jgi:hypothetical protein
MHSISLGKQIIKLMRDKNIEIVFDDEIIEEALTSLE